MKGTILAALVLVGGMAFAEAPKEKAEPFTMVHVTDVQKAMTDKTHPVFIFDANNKEIRKEFGVIPGAKLLESSSEYNLAVLPAEKDAKLVFYCANTMCTASHTAAKRAVAAGYKNVSIFTDGIKGWSTAGMKTDKL